MSRKKKIIIAVIAVIVVLLTASCLSDKINNELHPQAQQQQNQIDIRMLQDENKTLKNKLQTLEEQVSSLNETVYQNRKYIEELKEVYHYVAQDNEMPGTGEELPSDQLDNVTD